MVHVAACAKAGLGSDQATRHARRKNRTDTGLRFEPDISEFRLPEYAVSPAFGFGQLPHDAHSIGRNQQLLGARTGEHPEMGRDYVRRRKVVGIVCPRDGELRKIREAVQRDRQSLEV